MALLNNEDRIQLAKELMSDLSNDRITLGLTKAQVKAAIDQTDVWLNDNTASFNQSLPIAPRNVLTPKQKASLLVRVIQKRFEVT